MLLTQYSMFALCSKLIRDCGSNYRDGVFAILLISVLVFSCEVNKNYFKYTFLLLYFLWSCVEICVLDVVLCRQVMTSLNKSSMEKQIASTVR